MYFFGFLSVWWIYAVSFITSTLGIFFDSAEFAAIPSLVTNADDLVTANGRIQASYSAARIVGPLVAGVLVAFMPIPDLILFDALSFVVSAASLALIGMSFNVSRPKRSTTVRQDVVEGLRYVLKHPVLRNISIMMALVNFFGVTVQSQIILFSKEELGATDTQVSLLFSAGSAGVIVLSLLAGVLRKWWPFSKVALGSLLATGVLTIVLAFTPYYWLALPIWALMSGLGTLFNINTSSLRQAIVPNEMLGRIVSIAGVLAWSAIPLGSLLGGWAIEQTGSVVMVFAAIGLIRVLIPIAFALTPLGHAEDYLPKKEEAAVQAA
jgi:predicted MFS family arabinose efflux permease